MATAEEDEKKTQWFLNKRAILLIGIVFIAGIVALIFFLQSNLFAEKNGSTTPKIQYICIPTFGNANPPPSAPPTPQTRMPTYSAQGTPICPPGFVPQPIGSTGPKGMPQP